MKYGTQTRAKYLLPYKTRWKYAMSHPPQEISKEASMRLKWMDYLHQGKSILQASRHFDIPESTIRYWKNKYDPQDLKSLENISKRPKNVRRTSISEEDRKRVIQLREKYKGWGKAKIQIKLVEEGIHIGQSRIQKIINEAGLKHIPTSKKKYYKRRNRKHMYSVKKEHLEKPGGLVYFDVKHLSLPGGNKVYQFTAIDHATRIARAKLFTRITSRCAKDFLDYLQEDFPFKEILNAGTDNGSEFLGELDKELEERNIIHLFSSPASPKQNPFVERSIRTIIDELYYYEGLEPTLREQQEVLDKFMHIYNHERPHWSLGLKTPMQYFYLLKSNQP